MSADPRPLSPHLQIWKWSLTMALSILHRAAAIAVAAGAVVITWWVAAAATGPYAYDHFMMYATSPFGKFVLFGFLAAVYLHLFTGLRHFLMDMGYLLTIKSADRFGALILVLTAAFTLFTWALLTATFYGGVS